MDARLTCNSMTAFHQAMPGMRKTDMRHNNMQHYDMWYYDMRHVYLRLTRCILTA